MQLKSTHSEYISPAELAKILGISHVAVFKRIQKGKIKAIRIGRSYATPRSSVSEFIPQQSLDPAESACCSIAEAAKILGISHVAVFKRIQKGLLAAKKIGSYHVISKKDLYSQSAINTQAIHLLDRDFVSVPQLARLLGKNRITILKQIQKGQIQARKVGRHYVVARQDLPEVGSKLEKSKYSADDYISVMEAARLLGISRIAVFKKVKKGQIPAERMGRSYSIPRSFLFTAAQEKQTQIPSSDK